MRLFTLLLSPSILIFTACQTSPLRRNEISVTTNSKLCAPLVNEAKWDDEVQLLKTTQDLYEASCFPESLQLGRLLRERLRDKTYSVSSEVLSVLGPEQMTQTYVLESHERVYLTLLLAMNHLGLDQTAEATVELRRASQELDATLYNHGRDDVSTLLIASLWQEVDEPELARPFWRRLGLESPAVWPVFDLHEPWRIYRVGKLSPYEWNLSGNSAGGLYRIQPRDDLPTRCVSKTGVLIPVDDWVHKMAMRHSSDYHPLLNAKSFVRFPIALGYGLLMGGTGLAVGVGGCWLSGSGKNHTAEGCAEAVKAGAWIASKAPDIFEYTAQPDLRHWPNSPAAFLVTRAPNLSEEECSTSLEHASLR